ncbi:hypothetical protein LTR36_000839 [Oleoguttula mirabilis]|uniref:Uncharacterized protein n=1 Tax=Oleoguttula mirabilis TaxID=1507867 RepID=A0AAV9J334_9PEZI|nr:hypothetical protein LTR36_000839 [Oleoguttula mirabilis]
MVNDSADDDRPATGAAAHDHGPDDSPMPSTRRTSTTSAGLSDAGMQASEASIQSEGARRRARPRPLDYGSIQSSTTGRIPQAASPQALPSQGPSASTSALPPKRPGAAKRLPSSAAPRKGQEFSADDDPDEVDLDLELARTRARQATQQQQRERQLRRRESTLRRRPTAQVPTLRTVASAEHEEQEAAAAAVTGNDVAMAVAERERERERVPQGDGHGDPNAEDTVQGSAEQDEEVEEEVEARVEAEESSADAPGDGDDDADDDDDDPEDEEAEDEDEDADLSDAESFTLKDRQAAINETHPFGIRIWKPALYKKDRSVQRNAEGDIHSAPGGNVSSWLFIFNCLWTVIFGWWLALLAGLGGVLNLLLATVFGIHSCQDYGRVLINLSHYLFYPFGKYVKLERDEAYLDEDEGEGRSISEYERWQTGDLEEGRLFFGPTDINRSIIGRRRDDVEDLDPDHPAAAHSETDPLLGGGGGPRTGRQPSGSHSDSSGNTATDAERARTRTKKRLFGRGKWNVGRVVFFLSFYFLLTPCLFLVSGICWFLVFTIPMGKVTLLIFYHLRRHPLALSFHTDSHYSRVSAKPGKRGKGKGMAAKKGGDGGGSGSGSGSGSGNGSDDGPGHSVLLCTYRAVGVKYWKYTIDGTNIFLINLLGLVAFAIFDYFVLFEALGVRTWLTSPGLVFVLALASIIPLAYFIGQAVASISAQSSMGVGATINAFFSTVVEVFLYCVALRQGKAKLVEGSIIGSIFAGILFLPGLSMCFGALKRKTQRFNVKSAGVTSTMLLFAVIGAFGPTLFYQIYGSHELNCHQCVNEHDGGDGEGRECRRCFFAQVPAVHDRFYREAVQPYIWFATACLFLSYVVGLLFTLRTHAAVIWNNEPDEKRETGRGEEHGGGGGARGAAAAGEPGSGGVAGQDAAPLSAALSRPHLGRGETAGTLGSLARENIRESQMYKRILNQSLKQAGFAVQGGKKDYQQQQGFPDDGFGTQANRPVAVDAGQQSPYYMVPPKSSGVDAETASLKSRKSVRIHGLSAEDNRALVQQVAEMAATAATVAARDAVKAPRKSAMMATTPVGSQQQQQGTVRHHPPGHKDSKDSTNIQRAAGGGGNNNADTAGLGDSEVLTGAAAAGVTEHAAGGEGGHDAPNWSRTKSAVILCLATLAYAVIAEILVDTVDAVLSNVDVDEKFLGITLFALVPNTTEFLNAISFAMNGNVALSMEIGSSYALQVMLLQIPCLVLFSAVYGQFIDPEDVIDHTFSLIFPQWDMVMVILGVFLMGWVVGEGKSNYFKGSTLIFTYLVVTVGFWFSGYGDMAKSGISRFDMPGSSAGRETFKTVGRARSGMAY